MSLSDLEVLIFKVNANYVLDDNYTAQISNMIHDNGYPVCIVDKGLEWNLKSVQNLRDILQKMEITDVVSKNSKRKVVLLQARGFIEEDLDLVANKINDALIEYDINIVMLDERVKLQDADTFFNNLARHLGIYYWVQEHKKGKFKLDGEEKRKKNTQMNSED